jgi:hypothetical protein
MCVIKLFSFIMNARFRPADYKNVQYEMNVHGRLLTKLIGESDETLLQRFFYSPNRACSSSSSRLVNVCTIVSGIFTF